MTRWLSLAELDESSDLNLSRDQIRAVATAGSAEPVKRDILELIDDHGDAAIRTCRPGHLTGSALVVNHERDHFVLLFHRKLQRWLQPGGHADGDTNLARVALREATEETGIAGLKVWPDAIDVDIHLVSPPKEDAHFHHDVRFLVLAPKGADLVGNHESTDIAWVSLNELGDYKPDDGMRRLVTNAFATLDGGTPAG